jgi:hypothetical protein
MAGHQRTADTPAGGGRADGRTPRRAADRGGAILRMGIHAHGREYTEGAPPWRQGRCINRPPSYFAHISITTPIVSALKHYYRQNFLEVPADFFTTSEEKRPLHGGFGSETDKNLTAIYVTDIPQRTQVSVRV